MSIKETIKATYYAVGNIKNKPVTVRYPEKATLPLAERSRGMLSLDLDNCIGCELCFRICPADAIRMEKLREHHAKNARDESPAIDFGKCIFCGLCSEICPPKVLHHTHKFDISTADKSDLYHNPYRLQETFLKLVAPQMKKGEQLTPEDEKYLEGKSKN